MQSRVSMDNYKLKQERIIMQRNVLKSIAPLFFICLCACLFAACESDGDGGDGGGDGGNGGTEYKIGDLVGTWEIVHSQYVYKKDGSVIDAGSMDVSGEHNRFVFYSDGRFEFLEYDGDSRWHEDGKGTFYLRDGNFVFEGSYFHDARILSLSKTRLVAQYTVVEKTAVIAGREYTDVECEMTETMERIN